MNRWTVTYQGTAPGMGTVIRNFTRRDAAETWARQVGVYDRARIGQTEVTGEEWRCAACGMITEDVKGYRYVCACDRPNNAD